jgi:hypothetical protein
VEEGGAGGAVGVWDSGGEECGVLAGAGVLVFLLLLFSLSLLGSWVCSVLGRERGFG